MAFDYESEIEAYPAPRFWKAGLVHFINKTKIEIKSKKDLEKVMNDFNKIKLGD